MDVETADRTRDSRRLEGNLRRGVVVVFSGSAARFAPFELGDGPLRIGRAEPIGALLGDDRLSRSHAEASFSDGHWTIRDFDSRNGTFVDGVRVRGFVRVASFRVIRAGDTVLVPTHDAARARRPTVAADGTVVGAQVRQALDLIASSAGVAETILIRGESGSGKELAARAFHAGGPNARGPFVAVNCAAIPVELAERLLFGAKRGAYSGAVADAVGNIEAADGGTLFLDEGGELDPKVQAKLLRVLETREVIPLGASHGARVSVRVCIATHRDLRAQVAAGLFRADLYHRIAPPEVVLPPLRDRLDEIAFHIEDEIARAAPGLSPQAKLVEACILRHWPGNVRELRKQLRHLAVCAAAAGEDRVRAEQLPASAGEPLTALANEPPPGGGARPANAARPYTTWSRVLEREDVERALAAQEGNVSLAARSLGMQRAQLYREMRRLSVDLAAFRRRT